MSTPTPRAYRSADDRIIGGVCGGLGEHLGIPALWLRIAFIAFTVMGGFGIILYGALWLAMPQDRYRLRSAPGLEAASRAGNRPPRPIRLPANEMLIPLGVLLAGLLFLLTRLGGGWVFVWPLAAAVLGVGVLWMQADQAQRERWSDSTNAPWRLVFGAGGSAAVTRVVVGLALILLSVALLALETGQLQLALTVVVVGLVGILGVALVVGPWLLRLASDLATEREERIRSQERADVAALLHDSVLQTLALIQKQSGDPRAVTRLARAQERDLRTWLYDDQVPATTTLAAALRGVAAEVEDLHAVRIEVVTVGDVPTSDRTTPLVLAAREALTNSAKHSGVTSIDLYAEVAGDTVSVFVRDRGTGFDPTTVPGDRRGVRKSIEERMARHGGTAEIRTARGEGTEVRLSMQVRPVESPEERS
jgi:signal transduction histidine kinase/phage shock protein PspC (stress-responsive transcriptional regulator)